MNLLLNPKWRAAAGAFCLIVLSGCSATPPEDLTKNGTDNSALPADTKTSKDGAKTEPQKYTNTQIGLEGSLKENYVDFSFSFPADWEAKREAGDPKARNFIKVEKVLRDKEKGDFTIENFAVGYFKSSGKAAEDAKLYPKLTEQLERQFSEFPNFKKVSEGPITVNNFKGHELRFASRADKTPHGPLNVWGRAILLPNPKPGNRKGVAIIMLATSLQKEIRSAADVGEKGELPATLKSFKFEDEVAKPVATPAP